MDGLVPPQEYMIPVYCAAYPNTPLALELPERPLVLELAERALLREAEDDARRSPLVLFRPMWRVVLDPTIPLADRPCRDCHRVTAAWVLGPKIPSTLVPTIAWTLFTAPPREPHRKVLVVAWAGTGTVGSAVTAVLAAPTAGVLGAACAPPLMETMSPKLAAVTALARVTWALVRRRGAR